MKIADSKRIVRTREPSFRSHSTHFQSWPALRRWRSLVDQLSDCTWRVCPRSLRATPFVSMSKMTTMPSCCHGQRRGMQVGAIGSYSPGREQIAAVTEADRGRVAAACCRGESRGAAAGIQTHSRRRPVRTSGQSCARTKGSMSDRFIAQ
jgi:hypothetical protein